MAQTSGLVAAVVVGIVLVPSRGVLGAVLALGAGKSVVTALQVGLFVRYSGAPA